MGVIKTALEIALEKTETVKSDKASIELFEAKQRGKKLAGAFLAQEADLANEIKNTPDKLKESLKQGIFDVLISKIALPSGEEDKKLIETVGKGLQLIIKDKQFNILYQQLTQIFSQYLQEASRYEMAIRQQYAPKLRQKEEELSRRMGRKVKLDPFQDPEFAAFFNQNIQVLKTNYQAAVDQVREEAQNLFDQKEEELSRRFGRELRIDPMQDPEFISLYNQHMNALKKNYEGVIDEAKEQTRRMFEGN